MAQVSPQRTGPRLIVALPVALVAGVMVATVWFRHATNEAKRPAISGFRSSPGSLTVEGSQSSNRESTETRAQRIVVAALRRGGGIEADDELYRAIQALTAEDFRNLARDLGALKAIAERLSNMDRMDAFASSLTDRWLEVDSEGALAQVPRLLDLVPPKEQALQFALAAVAKKQPERLLALAAARKNSEDRALIISNGLRELMVQNPAKARAWLNGCTDPQDRKAAEAAVRKGTVEADPLRAIDLAAALPNRQEGQELIRAAVESAEKSGSAMLGRLATTPMPQWMLSGILFDYADLDPEGAVDLALKAGPDSAGNNTGYQWAFAALAKKNPAEAIAKLDGLTGQELGLAIKGIGSAWAVREPEKALEWWSKQLAESRADPTRQIPGGDDGFTNAFGNWFDSQEAAARAWAEALPEGETRNLVQTKLARSLAGRGNLAEATQILARMGGAAQLKATLDVARTWALKDPLAAADWAIAQPSGPMQSGAIASVVGNWANSDPHAVEEWLTQFPSGETRDRSVVAFLNSSISWSGDPAQQKARFEGWFSAIEDPWWRTRAALSNYWQMKRHDAAGAHRWLSSLPNLDPELVRAQLRDDQID